MNNIHDAVKLFNKYLDTKGNYGSIELQDTEQDIIDLIYRIKHLWVIVKNF